MFITWLIYLKRVLFKGFEKTCPWTDLYYAIGNNKCSHMVYEEFGACKENKVLWKCLRQVLRNFCNNLPAGPRFLGRHKRHYTKGWQRKLGSLTVPSISAKEFSLFKPLQARMAFESIYPCLTSKRASWLGYKEGCYQNKAGPVFSHYLKWTFSHNFVISEIKFEKVCIVQWY